MSVLIRRLLAMCCTICVARAAGSEPLRATLSLPVRPAPQIDGNLNDDCWESCQVTGQLVRVHSQQAAHGPVATHIRVAHDLFNLYVAIRCDEHSLYQPVVRYLGQDESLISGDDCVDILLDPGWERRDYYRFSVNVLGGRFDCQGSNAAWTGQWKHAVKVDSAGWTAEVSIPLATLHREPTMPGEVWGFNVCRYRRTSDGLAHYTWSNMPRPKHQSRTFGLLVFDSFPKALANRWEQAQPDMNNARQQCQRWLASPLFTSMQHESEELERQRNRVIEWSSADRLSQKDFLVGWRELHSMTDRYTDLDGRVRLQRMTHQMESSTTEP